MTSTSTLEKSTNLETKVTPVLQSRTLVLLDRCDSCGARAYYRAWKEPYNTELLFCGHHGRKNMPALIAQGFGVDDQTAQLYANTKPMSGSNMAD